MDIRVGVLGPVVAQRASEELVLGSPLQRGLLALLALDVGRPVTLDQIVDGLWGEEPPAQAETSVRSYVSNLRRALEPDAPARSRTRLLATSGTGYVLQLPEEAVDAGRFLGLARQAAAADAAMQPTEALAAATTALAIWRGPALADLVDLPFVAGAVTRVELERQRVDLVRLRSLVQLDRAGDALADLEAWLADDPTDEAATTLLMRALHDVGRPAEAITRADELRSHLDARGMLPSPAVQELEAAILRHDLPAPRPSAPAPAGLPDPPQRLVGRAALWPLVAEPPSPGDPVRWLVLAGEPGIGKTFVAEAVAEVFPGRVVWARARRGDQRVALGLWLDLLAELEGTSEPPAGVEAATRVLVRALRREATGAMLVVVDDVQWADESSLQVLSRLAHDLRGAELTVLLTTRPIPDPEAVDQALAEVLRQQGARRIELEPFEVDDVLPLAELEQVSLGEEDAASLHRAASGNPLLLRELLRLPAPQRDSNLPASIAAVFGRRLDPLPPTTTAVLRLAALVGEDVDVDLLVATTGRSAAEVLDELDPATRAGLLLDAPLRFRHAALRDVVVAGMTAAERLEAHERLARALAAAPPGRWPPSALLHHLAEARPSTSIADLLAAARDAAAAAAARGADLEQAAALDVAAGDEGVADGERLALLIDAAAARVRAGHDRDAQHQLSQAIELAIALEDAEAAAAAARVLTHGGGAWYWVPFGEHPELLLSRLDRALDLFPADDPTRGLLLGALAVGESYGPDPSRPRALAEQALVVAGPDAPPVSRAEALVAASWAGFGVDPPHVLLGLADELAEVGPSLTPERQALAEGLRLAAQLRGGQLAEATEALSRGETLARRHGLVAFDVSFAWARATVLAVSGRLRAAAEAAAAAHDRQLRTQVYAAALARALFSHHLADQRGEPATAAADAALLDRLDDHGFLYLGRSAPLGEEQDLVSRLAAVLDEPAEWHRVGRLVAVGHLVVEQGLRDLVPDVEQELWPYRSEMAVIGTAIACAGPVALVLARLALLGGRPEDALAVAAPAVDRAEALGLRGWLAPLLVEVAKAQRQVGDRPASLATAQRARDVARRVGQAGVVDAASSLASPGDQERAPKAASARP